MPVFRGVAFVTGATRRIGRVLAETCAEAGYHIALHHRGGEAADDLQSALAAVRTYGVYAAPIAGDLATCDAQDLIDQATAALGPVTLLINNASTFEDDRVGSMTVEAWDTQLAINLRAPVMLAQAMAARLPEGLEGQVVNLVDQRVWRPNPQFFSYSVSKAGLWWATQTLAQALAPRIRVNAIGPGPTLPNIHQQPGEFEAESESTPLGRAVSVHDIAAALRYLIDARSVTGQMIAVDAGQHLAWRTADIQSP